MLEYYVQASTLAVFCQAEHQSEEEYTSARQSLMVAFTRFCLLRRRPWFYFQVTYQLYQLRHGFSYDCSMLEYEVQASTLTIFLPSWTPLRGVRHKRPIVTDGRYYLILPLEAKTVILLPSHLSTISATPRIQLRHLNAIIKVNKFPPSLFSLKSNTPMRRKTLCSLQNFFTLGFASAVEFCCFVITIFYEFDVTSVRSHSCI